MKFCLALKDTSAFKNINICESLELKSQDTKKSRNQSTKKPINLQVLKFFTL